MASSEATQGAIDFSSFMATALYHTEHGYYKQKQFVMHSRASSAPASSDFVTAADWSVDLAHLIGVFLHPLWVEQPTWDFGEWGPGTGQLAQHLMRFWNQLKVGPARYWAEEWNAHWRAPQAEAWHRAARPFLSGQATYHRAFADHDPLQGLFLLHEIVDAWPVTRFALDGDRVYRLGVTLEADERTGLDRLKWVPLDLDPARNERDEKLCLFLEQLKVLNPLLRNTSGYLSEVNLDLEQQLLALDAAWREGVLLVIDYGYPEREYYHSERRRGTLCCYKEHVAHDRCLESIGRQDITAHVNFSHVARVGQQLGWHLLGFTTLTNWALATWEACHQDGVLKPYLNAATLRSPVCWPGGWGEALKVLVFGKGQTGEAAGRLLRFGAFDSSHRL